MRRIVVVMIAAIVLSSGASAYAEVSYDTDRHAVYNDEAGYRTIIVTEQENEENILYIDQNDSGFDTAIGFLLKIPVKAGTYTVRIGDGSNVKSEYFSITETDAAGERTMTRIADMNDGRVGFTIENVYIDSYKSIKVTYTKDGQTVTLGYPLSELLRAGSVSGKVNFGLQINDVPGDARENIEVSLSKEEVALQ